MVQGATGHFSMARWDYDAYVPVVRAALENMSLRIVGSKRGDTGVVFQAAPRTVGDRAVEVEVQRRPRAVDVHVLVYPLSLLPSETNRFRIWEGALGTVDNDSQSRVLLGELLTALRRDLDRRPRSGSSSIGAARVPSWVFFGFKAGRITWLLGALLAFGGVSYLLFLAPEGTYQESAAAMALLVFGAFPLLGGLWGRSGLRGAFTGLFAVFIPSILYALAMIGQIFPGLVSTQALAAIASPGQFQGGMAVILPLAFGIAGLVAGGTGGVIGARVFPLLPKEFSKTAGV